MVEEVFKSVNVSALGKGLASLIPQNKVLSDVESSKDKILNLTVDKIIANPFQPRKEFDEEGLRELADSIKMHGILEPLLVTRRADGGYELVAGERRLRAAKLAKLQSVPAILKEATDKQKMAWALTENLQRRDLNAIDEAKAYKFLQEEYHLSSEEIAKGFSHKSAVSITNMMRILKLPEVILNGVREGKIGWTHARTLLMLPRDDQRLTLYQLVLKTNMTKLALEEKITRILQESGGAINHNIKKNKVFPEIIEAEDRMSNFLNVPVKIHRNLNGQGRFVVEFKGADQMNELMRKILKN